MRQDCDNRFAGKRYAYLVMFWSDSDWTVKGCWLALLQFRADNIAWLSELQGGWCII
jgi:hypothetical protein